MSAGQRFAAIFVRILKVFTFMKRKSSHQKLESMCGQPGPDDGLDPRDFFKKTRSRRDSRKDWQVCRQVFETLNYVLSGDSRNDVLRGLLVSEVSPAPDATRLLVTVQPLDLADGVEPITILQHLHEATGRLRAEVARSISRRKVPELIFHLNLSSPTKPAPEGGLE